MNMRFQFRIVATAALLIGANASLMAQEETGTGDEVKSVEIRVVEEYKHRYEVLKRSVSSLRFQIQLLKSCL